MTSRNARGIEREQTSELHSSKWKHCIAHIYRSLWRRLKAWICHVYIGVWVIWSLTWVAKWSDSIPAKMRQFHILKLATPSRCIFTHDMPQWFKCTAPIDRRKRAIFQTAVSAKWQHRFTGDIPLEMALHGLNHFTRHDTKSLGRARPATIAGPLVSFTKIE